MEKYSLLNYIKDVSIQQYKTDVGFRTLVESVNENLYIIPKYQRKYRWNKEQVTGLIESLIYGLPIPPIYTCRNEHNQLEILDGQQRVMSLFFYYIGYYLNKSKNSSIDFSDLVIKDISFKEALLEQYELEKLDISFEGQHGKRVNVDYEKLPIELKRRIDYTPITVIEIKINDEKRKTQVLRQIFKYLNKGGSLLSAQEQRNGIYICPFYNMLQDLNRNNSCWRNVWGREDAKEQDLEALLRFCALKRFVKIKNNLSEYNFVIYEYNSSYVDMLDRFSEESMEFNSVQIAEYKESLLNFLELFDPGNKILKNITLLESLYVVYEKMKVKTPITDELCKSILDNEQYKSCARQGTVKLKNMNERWKAVYEIWAGANE